MRMALIALMAASLLATAASSQVRAPEAAPSSPPDEQQAASEPASAPASDGSTTVGGIVVEGATKDALRAFADAVEKFVHDEGQPGQAHQLSRWTRPICPETFGLREDYDAYISQRIRKVAQDVGASGPGKCAGTNVLIIFTIHPDAVMADVRDHHAILLGPHYAEETRQLAAFQPPMKSWYVTLTAVPVNSTANKDGAEVRRLDNAYGQEQPNCTHIRNCTLDHMRAMRSEFGFALVVVESDRIVGRPVGAVADEIAMTVLSKPGQRNGCSALPSVMDLLDPTCPTTKGLTAYDKAYLKALYAPHDTEILAYDRARISHAVQAVGRSPAEVPDSASAAAGEAKPDDRGASDPPG